MRSSSPSHPRNPRNHRWSADALFVFLKTASGEQIDMNCYGNAPAIQIPVEVADQLPHRSGLEADHRLSIRYACELRAGDASPPTHGRQPPWAYHPFAIRHARSAYPLDVSSCSMVQSPDP
jgi:hypothetical protein